MKTFAPKNNKITSSKSEKRPEEKPSMRLTLTAAVFYLGEHQLLPRERVLMRLWQGEFKILQNHLHEWEGSTGWRFPSETEYKIERPSSGNSQVDALLLQLEMQNLSILSVNCFPTDRDNDGSNDWVAIMHRKVAAETIDWLNQNLFL